MTFGPVSLSFVPFLSSGPRQLDPLWQGVEVGQKNIRHVSDGFDFCSTFKIFILVVRGKVPINQGNADPILKGLGKVTVVLQPSKLLSQGSAPPIIRQERGNASIDGLTIAIGGFGPKGGQPCFFCAQERLLDILREMLGAGWSRSAWSLPRQSDVPVSTCGGSLKLGRVQTQRILWQHKGIYGPASSYGKEEQDVTVTTAALSDRLMRCGGWLSVEFRASREFKALDLKRGVLRKAKGAINGNNGQNQIPSRVTAGRNRPLRVLRAGAHRIPSFRRWRKVGPCDVADSRTQRVQRDQKTSSTTPTPIPKCAGVMAHATSIGKGLIPAIGTRWPIPASLTEPGATASGLFGAMT